MTYSSDDLMKQLAEAVYPADYGPDLSHHAIGLYARYLIERQQNPDYDITFEDISGSTTDRDAMIELFRERALIAVGDER